MVSTHPEASSVRPITPGLLADVRRVVPILSGITVGVFAFTVRELVGYLPRFIAGGLLVGAGLSLLFDWLRELRIATSPSDRAASCLIVAVSRMHKLQNPNQSFPSRTSTKSTNRTGLRGCHFGCLTTVLDGTQPD